MVVQVERVEAAHGLGLQVRRKLQQRQALDPLDGADHAAARPVSVLASSLLEEEDEGKKAGRRETERHCVEVGKTRKTSALASFIRKTSSKNPQFHTIYGSPTVVSARVGFLGERRGGHGRCLIVDHAPTRIGAMVLCMASGESRELCS